MAVGRRDFQTDFTMLHGLRALYSKRGLDLAQVQGEESIPLLLD